MKINDRGAYLKMYAAQLPVFGDTGQDLLHQAHVFVVGTGRVGSQLAANLAAAGVGHMSATDPQIVDWDNGNSFIFRLPQDLGKQKVHVLNEQLGVREHLTFRPLTLTIESSQVDSEISHSNFVICCPNTVAGRLAAESKAIRQGKPSMQIATLDGRDRLGGLITLRLRENPWSACFGCYLEKGSEPSRGEGLLSTVTSALAAVAANMAVQLLSGIHMEIFRQKNLFYFDLENYTVESLAVQKRKGCRVCG